MQKQMSSASSTFFAALHGAFGRNVPFDPEHSIEHSVRSNIRFDGTLHRAFDSIEHSVRLDVRSNVLFDPEHSIHNLPPSVCLSCGSSIASSAVDARISTVTPTENSGCPHGPEHSTEHSMKSRTFYPI